MTTTAAARTQPPDSALGRRGLEHLVRLSDDVGLLEHADHAVVRREHGHCVDDNARAIIVAERELGRCRTAAGLLHRGLTLVLAAQAPDGRFHNRFGPNQQFDDALGTGDHWGRALWALARIAAARPGHPLATTARAAFVRGAQCRTSHPRSLAYATLGAVELLRTTTTANERRVADALFTAAVSAIAPTTPALSGTTTPQTTGTTPQTTGGTTPKMSGAKTHASAADDDDWLWPAPRLTYANARLPEALIAAGAALGDRTLLDDGVALLDWLVDVETCDGRLSPTPVAGRGRHDRRPAFDQQPIEAWALADAACRAYHATGDARWHAVVLRCRRWFLGDNDSDTALWDRGGGSCDGLTATGRNENQGAESTLALIGTLQAVRRCTP